MRSIAGRRPTAGLAPPYMATSGPVRDVRLRQVGDRLPGAMPGVIMLTSIVAVSEAVAGVLLDELALLAAAVLSVSFGLFIVTAGRVAAAGHARWVGWMLAGGICTLAALSAYLIPGAASAAAMLPVLSIVFVLEAADRRTSVFLVLGALAASAVVLLLGHAPHPFPPLRPPLDRTFPDAILLGVSLLFLAGLTDFARETRRALRASAELERQRVNAADERLAIVASLRELERQDTAEATAHVLAGALLRLPGIAVAGVYHVTDGALIAAAIVGDQRFPLRDGDRIPDPRAAYLIDRLAEGPFAEYWQPDARLGDYGRTLTTLGIRGIAHAPIRHGRDLVGAIAVATVDQDHARHLVADLPAVAEFAAAGSALLGPQLAERTELLAAGRSIDRIIESGAFRPVFQPIVEMGGRMTVGYEALTRFDGDRAPDRVFLDASRTGRGRALEVLTLRAAMREARRLPTDAWVSVNVSPELASDAAGLADALAGWSRPVVIEITEHEKVGDYGSVRETLRSLGSTVRLAVDDAGAGVANFNHLVELQPDFVKIDAGIVRGLDTHPAKQAVVIALLHFATTAGCYLIAEGVETEQEAATLAALGVELGQGYLFGRPVPADAAELSSTTAAARSTRPSWSARPTIAPVQPASRAAPRSSIRAIPPEAMTRPRPSDARRRSRPRSGPPSIPSRSIAVTSNVVTPRSARARSVSSTEPAPAVSCQPSTIGRPSRTSSATATRSGPNRSTA